MKTTILKSLASDIAESLAAELKRLPDRPTYGSDGIGDQLLDELVDHVVEAVVVSGELERKISGPVDPGCQDLERRGLDLDSIEGDDDDEVDGGRSSFPNLKYAKPKPESTEGHRWTA